jgi:prophage antirepressor-like protein
MTTVKVNPDQVTSLVFGDKGTEIKTVTDADGVWFHVGDVLTALQANLPVDKALALLGDYPEDVATVTVGGDEGDAQYTNDAGVYTLALETATPVGRELISFVAGKVLPQVAATGKYAPRSRRTRWGWQPIRQVLKARRLSGREFVAQANALELDGVETFSEGNYAAWSYGGCLPKDSLVQRASTLLGVPAEELFTADVLRNMPDRGRGKRHLQ